jgi:hypothetical protein
MLLAQLAGSRSRIKRPERMSGRAFGEFHAKIFGVSLGALFAVALILNAASLPSRTCHDRRVDTIDADFIQSGQAPASLAVRNASYSRSSVSEPASDCATRAVGEEPGY